MKLIDIDKGIYRKHLNRVIICFIALLTALSIGLGSLLIWIFVDSDVILTSAQLANDDLKEPVNNFKYNFIGVVLALLVCGAMLNSFKEKAYFYEIYYVWQLKQVHNLIYRRLKKVKVAAEQDDINALIILNFYYLSLEQVYLLDDNVLTLSNIRSEQAKLKLRFEQKNLNISTEQFNKAMLLSY